MLTTRKFLNCVDSYCIRGLPAANLSEQKKEADERQALKTAAADESRFLLPGLNFLSKRELETTDTELKAIARPADEVIFMASYERAKILK